MEMTISRCKNTLLFSQCGCFMNLVYINLKDKKVNLGSTVFMSKLYEKKWQTIMLKKIKILRIAFKLLLCEIHIFS